MNKKLAAKPQTFITKYLARIQKDYPQLELSTVNWESLQKHIYIRLCQFELTKDYTTEDIVFETIHRLDASIKKGKPIHQLQGWLKTTALYVVSELSRKNKDKNTSFCDPGDFETSPTLLKSIAGASAESLTDEDEKYQQLHLALSKLAADKQELLKFRFFMDMPWQKISEYYASQDKHIQATALRKRGARLLEELRELVPQAVNYDTFK
jgi:RNA polymerase sigma factor (sigma-70 family)